MGNIPLHFEDLQHTKSRPPNSKVTWDPLKQPFFKSNFHIALKGNQRGDRIGGTIQDNKGESEA
jgi:hypothetical protein